jgi:hypothetical protein
MRTFIFRTKPSARRLIDRIDRLRPYRDKSTPAAYRSLVVADYSR